MRKTATITGITYETIGLYASAFLIPAIFSAPQLITGTLVNALLLIASMRLSKKEILPVFVLPSLGALTHGILFGSQTMFLYYFLPFIWLSNYTYIFVYSGQNTVLRIFLSSFAKYFVLVIAVKIYFTNGIVPAIFVSSMGVIQLITAICGGFIAYAYERSRHSY